MEDKKGKKMIGEKKGRENGRGRKKVRTFVHTFLNIRS
jgi:hypothetical protein